MLIDVLGIKVRVWDMRTKSQVHCMSGELEVLWRFLCLSVPEDTLAACSASVLFLETVVPAFLC